MYHLDQDHLDEAYNPVHHIDLDVEDHNSVHHVKQDHVDQVEDHHALHDLDLVRPSSTGHNFEEEHDTLHDLEQVFHHLLDLDLVRPSSGHDLKQEQDHDTMHNIEQGFHPEHDDDLVRASSGLHIDQVLEQVQHLHLSSDLVDQDLAYGVLPNRDVHFHHQVGHSLDDLEVHDLVQLRHSSTATTDEHHHPLPHFPLDVDGLDKHHLDYPRHDPFRHPVTQPQQVHSRQPHRHRSCSAHRS
nr:hypothetical protein B0A51_14176 [Rachicladosporium sp. CCFEE 5018]